MRWHMSPLVYVHEQLFNNLSITVASKTVRLITQRSPVSYVAARSALRTRRSGPNTGSVRCFRYSVSAISAQARDAAPTSRNSDA